jgi:hypothetical protein
MDKKDKDKIIHMVRLVAVFLLLLAVLKGILVLGILMALSFSMSYIVNKFKLRQIGIELVTFTSIIAGMRFGPLAGLIVALTLITYHLVAGGFLAAYILWVIPSQCIAGAIAGFFPDSNISQIGLYLTLGINANNVFFTGITSPTYLPKYMIFVITNILFNVFLFSVIAPPLIMLF